MGHTKIGQDQLSSKIARIPCEHPRASARPSFFYSQFVGCDRLRRKGGDTMSEALGIDEHDLKAQNPRFLLRQPKALQWFEHGRLVKRHDCERQAGQDIFLGCQRIPKQMTPNPRKYLLTLRIYRSLWAIPRFTLCRDLVQLRRCTCWRHFGRQTGQIHCELFIFKEIFSQIILTTYL